MKLVVLSCAILMLMLAHSNGQNVTCGNEICLPSQYCFRELWPAMYNQWVIHVYVLYAEIFIAGQKSVQTHSHKFKFQTKLFAFV
ncbi:hypothetical protein JTE90_001109 [Oedothorax gibbosus]|uniref:Uncharacterized protein n=1 Tax=Oedothorax gibbosus TaxID=931172 RepID=A0AAV6VJP4_9ARAC|nr:hypothetical protein JTE90_001109 [Oedothorax gibbosus]